MMRDEECRVLMETERHFHRANILYMEDDAGLAYLLRRKLERMACMVDVARDGHEGLRMFEDGDYDLVIADYNMPGINGIEVLRRLKERAPVIILTGQGDEKVLVEALRLGAADYVTKDVGGEYLEFLPSIIDRVMERQQLIRERRQARIELLESEARYRAIVEDQTELICRFEPGGKLSFTNAAFSRYFGIRQGDIPFQNMAAILPRKAYQIMTGILGTLTPQDPVAMNTHSIKLFSGNMHWLQWTSRAIFDSGNKLKEYQLVGRDITELKRAEEALRESEAKTGALLNAIPDQIIRIDKCGICVDLRPGKDHALQLSPDFIGKNIDDIFPPYVVNMLHEHMEKVFKQGISQAFNFSIRQGDDVSHQEARLVYAGGGEALAIVRDVTERINLEQQLQYLSIHDSLTGLYNRGYFAEEMRRLENGRHDSVGIVVCDLDCLKMVNDNLGHGVGDKLLKVAAEIIFMAFRGSDAVARIGGDEFAVLLPNASLKVVEEACLRLRKLVTNYNRAKHELYLSISVGAAVSSEETPDLRDVFKLADEAMYADKLRRSKTVRNTMVHTLRQFLERKEVCNKEHSDHVRELMVVFGRAEGLSEEKIAALELFAEYHDIGKVALPEAILASHAEINSEEYGVIKRHCEVGHRIALATPKLFPVADWILKHHEWWNGLGYPLGLGGGEIPVECRMLAIVEAYESMTGGRYSSKARTKTEAVTELRRCAGTQFDPELVEHFGRLVTIDETLLG